MRSLLFSLFLLAVAALLAMPARAGEPAATQPVAKPFELLDGDRVVFVGGTFFEREAKWGYIETALTSRFPDRNVTFRNLGYAGDTVRCEARTVCEGWANFGPPQEGFDRLKTLIGEIKPTVVFVAYGMGESFEGEKALPQFVADYNKLLDMLTEASGGKPRFVLIGPNYHENLGPPLPEPGEHNRLLKSYCGAIEELGGRRGATYVDLYNSLKAGTGEHLTDDGIQLTPIGYARATRSLLSGLGVAMPDVRISIDAGGHVTDVIGAHVADAKAVAGRISFVLTRDFVPRPWTLLTNPPGAVAIDENQLRVSGLSAGTYRIGAANDAMTGVSAEALNKGVPAPTGDEGQPEELRRLIVAKNADYFNYWRHENDTYTLGYRKHEQGKNAVEFPEWVKQAEEKDKEIAKLRVPQPVTYTLERIEKAGK